MSSENLPNAMERIRQAACRDKGLRFTTLWHHVYNIEHLRKSYFMLKRDEINEIYSYEQHFDRIDLLKRIEPGK